MNISIIKTYTTIGSDNGLSSVRRQAIIWTNAGILLIGPTGTNFSEILIEIYMFSSKKMHLKMTAAKWRPFCLNVLRVIMWIMWPCSLPFFDNDIRVVKPAYQPPSLGARNHGQQTTDITNLWH